MVIRMWLVGSFWFGDTVWRLPTWSGNGCVFVRHKVIIWFKTVGAPPTTSSFSTHHLDWAKATARQDEKHFLLDLVSLILEDWRQCIHHAVVNSHHNRVVAWCIIRPFMYTHPIRPLLLSTRYKCDLKSFCITRTDVHVPCTICTNTAMARRIDLLRNTGECVFDIIRPQIFFYEITDLITSAMAKAMFSSLSVARVVCLSVCLLAILRNNDWTDFHEICRVGGTWYKEQLESFSGYSIKPFEHRIFSHFFGGIHASKQHYRNNGWTDFHEIFRKGQTWHKEQYGTFSGCCS